MFSWSSEAAALASSTKRRVKFSSVVRCWCRRLMATTRSSETCSALYITAVPPAATVCKTLKCLLSVTRATSRRSTRENEPLREIGGESLGQNLALRLGDVVRHAHELERLLFLVQHHHARVG